MTSAFRLLGLLALLASGAFADTITSKELDVMSSPDVGSGTSEAAESPGSGSSSFDLGGSDSDPVDPFAASEPDPMSLEGIARMDTGSGDVDGGTSLDSTMRDLMRPEGYSDDPQQMLQEMNEYELTHFDAEEAWGRTFQDPLELTDAQKRFQQLGIGLDAYAYSDDWEKESEGNWFTNGFSATMGFIQDKAEWTYDVGSAFVVEAGRSFADGRAFDSANGAVQGVYNTMVGDPVETLTGLDATIEGQALYGHQDWYDRGENVGDVAGGVNNAVMTVTGVKGMAQGAMGLVNSADDIARGGSRMAQLLQGANGQQFATSGGGTVMAQEAAALLFNPNTARVATGAAQAGYGGAGLVRNADDAAGNSYATAYDDMAAGAEGGGGATSPTRMKTGDFEYDLTPGVDGGQSIQFGQSSISPHFSSKGRFGGASIDDVANRLKSGKLTPDDLPIEYIWVNGSKVAVNNRSLAALSKAGLRPTRTVDMTGKLPTEGPDTLTAVLKRLDRMEGQPNDSIPVTLFDNAWDSAWTRGRVTLPSETTRVFDQGW